MRRESFRRQQSEHRGIRLRPGGHATVVLAGNHAHGVADQAASHATATTGRQCHQEEYFADAHDQDPHKVSAELREPHLPSAALLFDPCAVIAGNEHRLQRYFALRDQQGRLDLGCVGRQRASNCQTLSQANLSLAAFPCRQPLLLSQIAYEFTAARRPDFFCPELEIW